MEENKVKPFQKYSGTHVYHVENSLEVQFGEKKGFHSSCKLNIQETENEDHTKNWLIEKIEDAPLLSENPFMEVLHELEQSFYPLEIHVDEQGVFLNASDHKKNVENWKQKTANLHEKYENADVFRNQYLRDLEDEHLFYTNKQKEPFWNLLFFAPSYVDNGGKNDESIEWNIKGIGAIECTGTIIAEQRDYGFDSFFNSEIIIPAHLKEEIDKKYLPKTSVYKATLTIQMEYNSPKRQYSKKKAEFTLSDGEKILYREISSMI
ncbi:hypothetical protein [Chryseobacterium vrystaatense]|uniref:GLPGLI family protein n=1 Tax=Chryseobacterium vrystaatense TaxID=307480 RepID=A0ABR4UK22_9FLAO|nr:hypothetical protein [Chryseobacterium vrystaatense]KFF25100.1 hypothetical protein IW16_16885 [Chryseobacterium vrystaatense]